MDLSEDEMLQLEVNGLREGLEIAQEEVRQLRAGLEVAREWLEGWGSAEPYLDRINVLLKQGSSAAECEAHNLEVAGATPAPASIQAPIVRVTINDQYEISSCAQYAPGLPPGDHDLYCEPGGFACNSDPKP